MSGDPLTDVTVLKKVSFVMKDVKVRHERMLPVAASLHQGAAVAA
ncbi:MAG: hypothetical protein WAO00_00645 [Chthoniobacterales bacterium]